MDPVTLATTIVVSILRPYIMLGTKKVSEAVTDKIGKAAADFAAETASKTWNYIKSAFQSDREKRVVKSFEEDPKRHKGCSRKFSPRSSSKTRI